MKNRARRILALLLAAVMALGLAACGKENGEKKPGKPAETGDHPEFTYAAEYKELVADVENDLSPRIFTEDGYYAVSWEKTGENIPEGVTPSYEGEYAVYSSFLYFVSFDGGVQKLDKYKPLEAPADDTGLRDFNSSSDLSGLCVADDGRLAVIENQYKSWSEAPEDVGRNSEDYWQYQKYEQSYFIRWLEKDGTEISCAPIQLDVTENYLESYRMQLDDQGNALCSYNGSSYQLVAIAADGTISYSIETDNYVDSVVKLAEGQLAISTYDDQGQVLIPIDTGNKALSDKSYPLGNYINMYNAISGSNGYDLYCTSGANFYGLKLEEGKMEKLFSWLNCDVNSNDIGSVTVRKDGSVVGIISDYDRKTHKVTMELVTVKQVPYDSVPHKETITLGCMNIPYQTQEMVVDFNRSNDQYRIEIINYGERPEILERSSEGTTLDYEGNLAKFNTEIMAGNVPDILDINSLNYVQLASKGIIEDLYPYIDADADLKRDDFFENVLKAMEVDGKLCATVSGFYISTVMGASSVVGDTPGWTYDQFMAALATMPEGCEPFDQYVTRDSILQNCLALDMGSFVNWGTGECHFDSPEFVNLLEFSALFPETFDWEHYDYSNEESTAERLAQGKQMLVEARIHSLEDLFYNQHTDSLGGSVTFIGYPTVSGVGNMLGFDSNNYAMSSKSQNKEAVWQFLRNFMTKEYQEEYVWGLATRKDIFEEKAQEAMTVQYREDGEGNAILDENGEKIPIARYGMWDEATGQSVEIYSIPEEQIDQIRELIACTDKYANYDSAIFKIVSEQSAAFFEGQKSAEEVAKLIQSKANIFVNEQR